MLKQVPINKNKTQFSDSAMDLYKEDIIKENFLEEGENSETNI